VRAGRSGSGPLRAGINVAMEASVAAHPIHAVLRGGHLGRRISALYGILRRHVHYILTEIEKRDAPLEAVLEEAQRLGYAEAIQAPIWTASTHARSWRSWRRWHSGRRSRHRNIFMEASGGYRRWISNYAHQLGHTIRLICAARQTAGGTDPFGAAGADSAGDDPGRRAGRVQRHLGEGHLWRRHVLLRAGGGGAGRPA